MATHIATINRATGLPMNTGVSLEGAKVAEVRSARPDADFLARPIYMAALDLTLQFRQGNGTTAHGVNTYGTTDVFLAHVERGGTVLRVLAWFDVEKGEIVTTCECGAKMCWHQLDHGNRARVAYGIDPITKMSLEAEYWRGRGLN